MPKRKVKSKGELRRLTPIEDWNLVTGVSSTTTRTRGSSIILGSNEHHDVSEVVAADHDSTSTVSQLTSEVSIEATSNATPGVLAKKPTHSRVILEVSQLQQAFANYPCPECNEPLELTLRTVCIATSIELICNNKDCSYQCNFDRPSPTSIHDDDDNYERMTDYAANVMYVLCLISVGDGATEAGRILGMMGLPNDTTMMNRSFGIIEERVGRFAQEMCDEIIKDNIDEEVRLSTNEFDYNVWKMWSADPSLGPMPVERMPKLDASYDMAWQQKGSGHVYNSQSGHGTLFGRYTRKIIGLVVKSKLCCYCNKFAKKNDPTLVVPAHRCWKNHNGSSGSMESSGAVQCLTEAVEKHKVVIKRLCCDDDSSIRADCQWSNADYLKNNSTTILPKIPISKGPNKGKLQDRPDKGKLPANIPEPIFVADPNHRRKVLTGELIKLDTAKKDIKLTMTRMDTTRIGKNFGYMARTLKDRHESDYEDAAKACLQHHFDNRIYCGAVVQEEARDHGTKEV
jgi:hypothetical protein